MVFFGMLCFWSCIFELCLTYAFSRLLATSSKVMWFSLGAVRELNLKIRCLLKSVAHQFGYGPG